MTKISVVKMFTVKVYMVKVFMAKLPGNQSQTSAVTTVRILKP